MMSYTIIHSETIISLEKEGKKHVSENEEIIYHKLIEPLVSAHLEV